MMPLWMTASLSSSARCGCALVSVGPPWVAQRVWPMPVVPSASGLAAEVVAQHLELAGALAHAEIAVAVDHGDAGGVVAPVLEPREAGEEDGLAVARAHVSDDSTHALNARRRVMRGA